MRSLGTRRVAMAAGVATVAVIALAGCSAGQVAETAILKPPISGLNTQSADGGLLIRNLQVVYNSPEGYPAGSSAPIEVGLFNETREPMTVTIASGPAQGSESVVHAQQVGLTGGAAAASPSPNQQPSGAGSPNPDGFNEDQIPDPTGGASAPAGPGQATGTPAPTTAPVQPARITIPPLSSAVYLPGEAASIQLIGLSDKLSPGRSVNLTFAIGNGEQLSVVAPFQIPYTPAPRGSSDIETEEGGH